MSWQEELRRLNRDWATANHQNNGWPLFLAAVKIEGLCGWDGEQIEFRYPIVAIAGENGSGKSTVLKVAAAAYTNSGERRTLNPEDFFPKTQWEDVRGVRLTYTVRRGDQTETYVLRKPSTRWRGMPERVVRSSYFLDISRTQPIDTLIGYGKIAKETAFGDEEVELADGERRRLARILKREYSDSRLVVSGQGAARKQVGVLTVNDTTYSNFHQGAGEDSTADLIGLLQEAPSHSLVIIDEVEASLHPRAQRRLVGELLELARTKRLQFVLSTHSPYVLEALPDAARVYLQGTSDGGRDPIYGVSPEFALTMMDDEQRPDLTIYAEDERAVYLAGSLLADAAEPTRMQRVQLVPAGPANVVKILGALASQGKLPARSIGLLDGNEAESQGCIRLPGTESPERVVFNAVQDSGRFGDLALRLEVAEGQIQEAVADAMNLEDAHEWPGRVADAIRGPATARRVWERFVDFYTAELVEDDVRDAFVRAVEDLLP